MSTENMNENIRTAAGRRFTVDESPTDAGTVEMNRAIRRQSDAEAEPAEPAEPPFPDLGQGARGPVSTPAAPNMSALLRRQFDWRRSGFGDLHPLDEQA